MPDQSRTIVPRLLPLVVLGLLSGGGITSALAQGAGLPPWESQSGRSNPFDPVGPFTPPAVDGGIRGQLQPLPPVPLGALVPSGPTTFDRFQELLDRSRMQGVLTLQGRTQALVALEGTVVKLSAGDTVRIGDLTLEVLEVAPTAVVFSAEEGSLVGMLPRDPDTGLQVIRAGSHLVIRSVPELAE